MEQFYRSLLAYGFRFEYAERDGQYCRGWIASFIHFQLPPEKKEMFNEMMHQLTNEQLADMVDLFIVENVTKRSFGMH